MSDVSYHRERAKVNINKAVEFEQAENYQEAFNSYLQVLDCFKSMIKCKNSYLRNEKKIFTSSNIGYEKAIRFNFHTLMLIYPFIYLSKLSEKNYF